MPGVDYTTTGLISSIKRRITLPQAQNLFSDEDLIAFMGDELSSSIIPLVHSVQQEYWIYKHDELLVQNQLNYKIPIRGCVNGLRYVSLVDPNGNEIEFPLLRPEMTASTYNWLSPYTTSTLYGFYMEDDHIVTFPQQMVTNPTDSYRFRFERQPSQLCSVDAAAQVTAINGNVITVSSIPDDWTTSLTYDWTNGQPAFQAKMDDMVLTAIDTMALTLTFSEVPEDAAIGDWISVAWTSPIPQIPYQMFPYLTQCVANLCMASMSDSEPYKQGVSRANQMKEDLLKLMQPRDLGNVQTVINRGGLFDSGQFWGWSGGIYW